MSVSSDVGYSLGNLHTHDYSLTTENMDTDCKLMRHCVIPEQGGVQQFSALYYGGEEKRTFDLPADSIRRIGVKEP